MSESFLSRWARLKRGEPGSSERPGSPGGPDDPGSAGSAGSAGGPAATGRDSRPETRSEIAAYDANGAFAACDANAGAPGKETLGQETLGQEASGTEASPVSVAPTATSPAQADGSPLADAAERSLVAEQELPLEGERELPPLDSLTPQSDFRPFLRAGVEPQVRNAALKTLFADPHFNVMDGLDVYIEDYNLTTPIAESTMRRLAHASTLRLFEDLVEGEAAPTDSDHAPPVASAAQSADADPVQEATDSAHPDSPPAADAVDGTGRRNESPSRRAS